MKVTIRVDGMERVMEKLALVAGDSKGMIARAAHATAERLRDEIAAQPWGAGNRQFPVRTGALRDSGRVAGNTLYWDDLEYAGIIERRGGGFFKPVVDDRGADIFKEEMRQELDAVFFG